MQSAFRIQLSVLVAAILASGLQLVACSASKRSSPVGTVSGTVVRGASETTGSASKPVGLAGVTVSVSGMQRTAVTDGSGRFTLTGVPSGEPELHFERADINARGRVSVATDAVNRVTVAIQGTRAEIVEGRRAGEEIQGLVSEIDNPNGTLTVLDQRQQAVVVHADHQTVIRSGDRRIALAQVPIGSSVHVDALARNGWTLATEVVVETEESAASREVEGPVTLTDRAARSFVVQTESGPVMVTANASTRFERGGKSASFDDVIMGVHIDVLATAGTGGALQARKVTIES